MIARTYRNSRRLRRLYVKALEKLLREGPTNSNHGICLELADAHARTGAFDFVMQEAQDWRHYSGRPGFPIPSPQGAGHAGAWLYYVEGQKTGTLWTGRQLDLRHSLIRHLIARLRELGV